MRESYEDISKLILRFGVGYLMLFHGFTKLRSGIDSFEGMFFDAGIPSIFANGIYVGEVLAPLMLIIGFQVRLASLFVIITMIGAIYLVHLDDLFVITQHGAWAVETQIFYILAALAILFQGAGQYSMEALFNRV